MIITIILVKPPQNFMFFISRILKTDYTKLRRKIFRKTTIQDIHAFYICLIENKIISSVHLRKWKHKVHEQQMKIISFMPLNMKKTLLSCMKCRRIRCNI